MNMTKGKIDQEFRCKKIEKENYFIEEMKQNELVSKKHKKVYKILNYTDYLLILTSTVTGCVSISGFSSLVGILSGIENSAVTIQTCV